MWLDEQERIEYRPRGVIGGIAPTGYTADSGFTSIPIREVVIENTTIAIHSVEVVDDHTRTTGELIPTVRLSDRQSA